MKTFISIFRRITTGMLFTVVPMLNGCGDSTLTWQEEVKLLDGRVITVTQKRRIDTQRMPREFWLIFKVPELGNREITWHESLLAQVLNVYQGKVYVVGTADTEQSFRQYGNPNPSYVGYRYDAGQWQRIPFSEIPEAIYVTNLLIANEPPNSSKYVSFEIKAEEMKNDTLGSHYKRINPKYVSLNY